MNDFLEKTLILQVIIIGIILLFALIAIFVHLKDGDKNASLIESKSALGVVLGFLVFCLLVAEIAIYKNYYTNKSVAEYYNVDYDIIRGMSISKVDTLSDGIKKELLEKRKKITNE